MSRNGWESLQEVRETLRMSGSCRKTLPIVQEWWNSHPDVQELSGDSPECP